MIFTPHYEEEGFEAGGVRVMPSVVLVILILKFHETKLTSWYKKSDKSVTWKSNSTQTPTLRRNVSGSNEETAIPISFNF